MDAPTNPYGLPINVEHGQPVSASTFDLLLEAARKGGMKAVLKVWGEGEEVMQKSGRNGGPYKRAARESTLREWLRERRPDLGQLLEDACNVRRSRLVAELENEIEKIAMSEGDVTLDYGKTGKVTRKRVDRRNKLQAIIKLLASHEPEVFSDRKRVDVTGQIDHQHNHQHRLGPGNGFTIQPHEVAALADRAPERAALLLELLDELNDMKGETNGHEEVSAGTKYLPAPQPPNDGSEDETAHRRSVDG